MVAGLTAPGWSHEYAWWQETTDSYKLSSDLHTNLSPATLKTSKAKGSSISDPEENDPRGGFKIDREIRTVQDEQKLE